MTTVTDNLGNYNPATDTLNGCTDIGDNREDDRNEQFTVVPPFDFTTLSSPQGPDHSDVKVVTDTITILGFNGTEGSFNATGTLYLDGVGEVLDDDSTVVCLPDPLVTDTFTSATTITCTWDRTAGAALLPGTYCWMITVDEGNMNYDPDSVTHNGCALSGANPENESSEQFTVPGQEGCTPGYWRNNLAMNVGPGDGQAFTNWEIPHTDLFSATFPPHDPDLKSAYKHSIHKAQGKWKIESGESIASALWAQGGQENALARHGVAALLNAASSDVSYALTEGAVVTLVSEALASGDQSQIAAAKNTLATENERGCPIDQQPREQD